MRILKGKFNISLAKIDYFHLRECWYSNNKIIEEEKRKPLLLESFESNVPNTQIFTSTYLKYVSRHFMGGIFIFAENSQWDCLSDIIHFRLKGTEFD